jgi:triosephosphate isomerase
MRQKLIIGNWKMYNTIAQTEEYLREFIPLLHSLNSHAVLCIPYTALAMAKFIVNKTNVLLGAQNIAWDDKGPYTGEISGEMLKELNVRHCLIGHSERRKYFGETDETVNSRALSCLKYGMTPVICVGESLTDRKNGRAIDMVSNQLSQAFANITAKQAASCIVAYEPVWAIGSGQAATEIEAQEMALSIRRALSNIYPGLYNNIADQILVLYGGSVTSANAGVFCAQPDIDGLLVGGASLKVAEFVSIIKNVVQL